MICWIPKKTCRGLKGKEAVLAAVITVSVLLYYCYQHVEYLTQEDFDTVPESNSTQGRQYDLTANLPVSMATLDGRQDHDKEGWKYKKLCSRGGTTSMRNYTSQKLLINTNKCWKDTHLLIFVHSDAKNAVRRNVIRRTWASWDFINGRSVKVIFVCGRSADDQVNAELLQEDGMFRDILQGNFTETYEHLTLKHLYALRWILDFCPSANFVFKTDDDTFVNTEKIIQLTSSSQFRSSKFFYCMQNVNRWPNRNRFRSWFISYKQWPEEALPPYCQGFGYLMPAQIIAQVFYCSLWQPYISVDDAVVSGIVRTFLDIPLLPPNSNYAFSLSYVTLTEDSNFLNTTIAALVDGRPEVLNRIFEWAWKTLADSKRLKSCHGISLWHKSNLHLC